MGWFDLAETAAASVTTPASGRQALYVDTADNAIKLKNSSGNSRTIDGTLWRTLHQAYFHLGSGITAGTFVPHTSSGKTAVDIGVEPLMGFHFLAADYGTGIKMRVRINTAHNATAPGTQTFTAGLYPITVAGGSSLFVPTLGTVVTGSTAAIVNPLLSTHNNTTLSSEFLTSAANFTDNTFMVLGYTTSATTATNSFTKVTITWQIRNT